MADEPLDDTALESEDFRIRFALPAIELGNGGPLVEERAPVLSRPPVSGRCEQFDDLGLVARNRVHHVDRWLEVSVEDQIGTFNFEPYSARLGHADRFDRAHIRFLQ